MALTQDFKHTIVERVRRDPAFARALLDEAATLFLNGEADTARLVLRDLVNATVGFEELAAETAKPVKSLHRMLSKWNDRCVKPRHPRPRTVWPNFLTRSSAARRSSSRNGK